MPPLTPAGRAERLRTLGFRFVAVPLLEFGLREFQTYASAPRVAHVIDGKARIYSDGLESVENTDRFTGPPHGHADERTLSLLETWVTNGWRCPVVIEAWWTKATTIPDRPGIRVPEGEAIEATRAAELRWRTRTDIFNDPNGHNVWFYDDAVRLSERVDAKTRRSAVDNGVRFYARDFSGWFDGDPDFQALKESNGRILLGRHKAKGGNGPVSTPVSEPPPFAQAHVHGWRALLPPRRPRVQPVRGPARARALSGLRCTGREPTTVATICRPAPLATGGAQTAGEDCSAADGNRRRGDGPRLAGDA